MPTLVDLVLRATPMQRQHLYLRLSPEERRALDRQLDEELSNPWRKYEADPVAFVRDGLGETVWSKQREILESVRDNKRTAVPACHAPGKTHIAARVVAWWVSVHPPGTAMAMTTASSFRQVRNLLWPHIRRVAVRHELPGYETTLMVEWQREGEIAAYGFAAADTDETAVQGIHAPHLLVVVDEAGGISRTLGGAMEALMTGGHTRMLVLGNPPTDEEDTWFERVCSSPLFNTIRIPASDTPNFTGEDAGICKSCPPTVTTHPVTDHLVDETWVDDIRTTFGESSAFWTARVEAEFPRNAARRVIPIDWVEESYDNPDPIPSQKIRLGVDVASDGGDEVVVARADGWCADIVHTSAGAANANSVDVAGDILQHILDAEETHAERGVTDPVRVKVDAIGLGWGVVSQLEKWRTEGRHGATIVGVNVGERAKDAEKFQNQRAELWWTGRELFQPKVDSSGLVQAVKLLDRDKRLMAQLTGPLYATNTQGRIVIEKKADLKKRLGMSPDRAEALLLALYEPPKADLPTVGPIRLGKSK